MRVSGCGWFRGAARRGAPSRSVPWTVPVSALRHQAERRAGKGTPTSGVGHSPPQAGGREETGPPPRVGGVWFRGPLGPRRPALRENWPALQALSGAGFALPRDAGSPGGARHSPPQAGGREETGPPPRVGGVWFRGPLGPRCRSETPTGRTGRRSKRCRRWFRAPARCRSETGAPSVVGAGFALPRDAGRRCRSETRRSVSGGAPSVVGAGFALPRDAGRRPALQALSALVSRSRAMPVGDRRSKRCRRWFRAPARCRSETGAPSVVGAGFALPRDAGRRRSKRCRRWFRAPARCRSETGAPSVVGAGFALPRDAGRRPALQALSALVSRSRAMPVRDRRSKRCRRWFRAPARCRSEALHRRSKRCRRWFRAPARCRSETGAPCHGDPGCRSRYPLRR